MSTSNTGKAGFDFSGLIATISSQPDPLRYLVQYLQAQRLPAQGPFFRIQAYVGLGVHGCIIVVILAATWVRSRRDQLWFTRKQQGRLRLNATVIGILFLAIYSSMAVAYTCLLLQQQTTGRYLAGSAAFQMSCFSAISFCVSVIAFTYHQSLPVGFESSFFRKVFHKRHAAEDSRFFSFAFLCIWLITSLAGLMTFPIIHDYWRRQIDSNIQGIITYLERQDVRERGLSALLGVADQFSNLPHQVQQAQLAMRRQLLVYIAHCGLYLLVIVPVAFKLISLLNKQMEALRRSAEDYFRLGTRLNQAPKAKDRSAAKQPLLEMPSQNGRMHVNDKITCPKIAITPCDNRDHDLPVSLAFAKQNPPERGEFIATRRPPVPRYDLHPDFPLHKLQRLKRVRLELAGFSAVIIIGLVNFMAWTCVAYGSTPGWTSSQVTSNLFVISLWSYAIPAGISCVFYAYTTALSAKPASSRSSTAASQRSGPSKSSCSGRTLSGWLPFVKSGSRSQAWGQTNATTANGFKLLDNKRSRPTFPRMPSTLSFGGPLTPALDMEVLAKAKECEYPVVRSTTETLQWVEEQKRVCAKDVTIRAPSPSLASRVILRPLRTMSPSRAMPASMTQSWLEIDED